MKSKNKSSRLLKTPKSPKAPKSPKFAFGGTAMNIDSPSEDLAQIRKNSEDALYGAKFNPASIGLRALGGMLMNTGMGMASKGMSQSGDMSGIGGFLQDNFSEINKIVGMAGSTSYMATGGVANQVPINAEGDEVIESPFGLPVELAGPSHSEGGIDLNVPQGTNIYSKRLKGPDGKSMADRKKQREKKEQLVSKLSEDNPTDKVLQKTLKRVKTNNDLVDKQDVSKMQMIHNLSQMVGAMQHFATGGTAGPLPVPHFLNLMKVFEDELQPLNGKMMDVQLPDTSFQISSEQDEMIKNSKVPLLNTTQTNSTTNKTNPLSSIFGGTGGLTFGDTIGLAGNLISSFGPLQNTLKNRKGDTPNVNALKNYGKNALQKMEDSKQYINQVRDNKLQDLELERQGTINRNNSSARGLNTIRALNLATDSMANGTKSSIYDQFASAMQNILGQEATLHNDKDAHVMQGEYQRDLADRQDRDNFFTQLSKDISTMGTGLQYTGKNVNSVKTRDVTSNLMNQLYNNFGIDSMSGSVKARATQELNDNPNFYANANPQVFDKIMSGEFIRKGNDLYDKDGNTIDPKTLNIINYNSDQSSKYKLNVNPEDIYDYYSPYKTGQA